MRTRVSGKPPYMAKALDRARTATPVVRRRPGRQHSNAPATSQPDQISGPLTAQPAQPVREPESIKVVAVMAAPTDRAPATRAAT